MRFFIFDFCGAERLLFRLFEFLSSWIVSMRAAYRLRVSPDFGSSRVQWLAHALNGRRVGGVACHGDLVGPACRALVG